MFHWNLRGLWTLLYQNMNFQWNAFLWSQHILQKKWWGKCYIFVEGGRAEVCVPGKICGLELGSPVENCRIEIHPFKKFRIPEISFSVEDGSFEYGVFESYIIKRVEDCRFGKIEIKFIPFFFRPWLFIALWYILLKTVLRIHCSSNSNLRSLKKSPLYSGWGSSNSRISLFEARGKGVRIYEQRVSTIACASDIRSFSWERVALSSSHSSASLTRV